MTTATAEVVRGVRLYIRFLNSVCFFFFNNTQNVKATLRITLLYKNITLFLFYNVVVKNTSSPDVVCAVGSSFFQMFYLDYLLHKLQIFTKDATILDITSSFDMSASFQSNQSGVYSYSALQKPKGAESASQKMDKDG